MSTNPYRIWVPVSLALHIVLLLLIRVMPVSVSPVTGERLVPIDVVEAAVTPPRPPVLPPALKPVVKPPTPEPVEKTEPAKATPPKQTKVNVKPGVPNSRATKGTSISNIRDTQPGPGNKPTAPPDVMRVKNGQNWAAPQGNSEGTGTAGTELGPSGPSYGAAAQGGPVPGYPKLAEEEGLEGDVTVALTIGPDGSIDGTAIAQASGYSALDSAALRAARAWRFTPAMEKGTPTSDTVRIRFRFRAGSVTASAL